MSRKITGGQSLLKLRDILEMLRHIRAEYHDSHQFSEPLEILQHPFGSKVTVFLIEQDCEGEGYVVAFEYALVWNQKG